MAKTKLASSHPVMNVIQWIEWLGLTLITLAVIIAIYQEVEIVIERRRVELYDILLLFIYLEVITMVALYFNSGKLPVRYPIYITIVAISRYIILDLKQLEALDIIWLAVSVLLLTLAALVLRYGHYKLPYQENID